jgi:hypothetical protein
MSPPDPDNQEVEGAGPMAVTGNVFFSGVDQAVLTGWGTAGRLKLALFASAPALTVVDFNGADLSTGNGYTEGGLALPSLSHTVTAAASWPVSWTSGNAYTVNNIVALPGSVWVTSARIPPGAA